MIAVVFDDSGVVLYFEDFIGEVGLPGNIEDHDISSQDGADWIVTHLDEIEDKYAAINNIPNREPEEEMGDWVAEQTGQIVTNR